MKLTLPKQARGNLYLLCASFIWGTAFVAQSVGMEYVGPFTFVAVRSFIAALSLFLVSLLQKRRIRQRGLPTKLRPEQKRSLLRGSLFCGLLLTVGSTLQQIGMLHTTVGKAGFLTALYILLVPLAGMLMGRRPRPALWLAIALAVAGLYLLSIRGDFSIGGADLLIILCAVVFTAHILMVDHYSPRVSGVSFSLLQFLIMGLLAAVPMLLYEKPRLSDILRAWLPLLYAGVLSSAVANTLQIVAQRLTIPTVASLLMSMESVFALLGGMVILGQIPTAREALGSALMLAAIIFAQIVQLHPKEKIHETV